MRLRPLLLFALFASSLLFAAATRTTRIEWFALDWKTGVALLRAVDQVDGSDVLGGSRYFVGSLPEGHFRELRAVGMRLDSGEFTESGTLYLSLGEGEPLVVAVEFQTQQRANGKLYLRGTATVASHVFTVVPDVAGLPFPPDVQAGPLAASLSAAWFDKRRAHEVPNEQLMSAAAKLDSHLRYTAQTPTTGTQLLEANLAWSRLPNELRWTPAPSDIPFFLNYTVKNHGAYLGAGTAERRVYVSLAPHSRYGLRLTIRDGKRRVLLSEIAVSVFDSSYEGRDAWVLHSLNARILLLADGSFSVSEHASTNWRTLGWSLKHADLSVQLVGKEGPVATALESQQRIAEVRSESWEKPLQQMPFPPEPLHWIESAALIDAGVNTPKFWSRLARVPRSARALFFDVLTQSYWEAYVFASENFAEQTKPSAVHSCALELRKLPRPAPRTAVDAAEALRNAMKKAEFLFAQFGV